TLFMVLAGGLQALLARYAGSGDADDVVLGTPVAGRDRAETEGLIGFFVNTLLLRTGFGGGPDGREVLARTRAAALRAVAHHELPLETVAEALAPRRDLGRAPLSQAMVALQNAPAAPLALPGLGIELLALANETAELDLTVAFRERASGIAGGV